MDNKTYFYKIMISPLTQTNKLRIPEEYVNKDGQQFAFDYVRLRVGKDGRVWRVEVYKENDQIWLTQGWERVVMNYSIKHGDFLLFKYDERDSMFRLKIFDMTGFEIEYDHQQVEQISSASEEEEMDLDDDDDDDLSFSEDDDVAVHEPMDPTDVKSRLDAYKTKKPHFKVIMRPSYVSNGFRYSLPIRHVRIHLKLLEVQQIHLKATDHEKSYPVRLNLCNKNSQAALGFGWKKFVLNNDLQAGDGCVFKLVCPQSNSYQSFPIRHVRSHLKLLEYQQIQLKATDHEKSHPVRLNLYNKNSQAAVGLGWKNFVLNNDLHAGDGCVFELVCPQTHAYKVTIFRVAATA